MVFGVRDICNATFKALRTRTIGNVTFQKGQPVFKIDTAKTSALEGTSTTVYATGGRGNNNLIAWDGEKNIKLTIEDATLSPQSFAVLANAGLIKGANGTSEEVYYHMNSNTYIETRVIDLSNFLDENDFIAEQGMIYVSLCDEDDTIQEKMRIPVKITEEEVDGVPAGQGLVPKAYDYADPDNNTFETLSTYTVIKEVSNIAPPFKHQKIDSNTTKDIYTKIVNATDAEGSIYRIVENFAVATELQEFFETGVTTVTPGYYKIETKKLTKMIYEDDYLILPQALTDSDLGKYYKVTAPLNTSGYPDFFVGIDGKFKGKTDVQVVRDNDVFKYRVVTDTTSLVGRKCNVDYYILENMSDIDEMQIETEGLAGSYYVEADTLFRRKYDNVDLPAQITFPNAHIQSNFNFQMTASGDPSTFSFVLDAFPGYTYFNKKKKVLALIQIVNDGSQKQENLFSLMENEKDFTPEEKKWDSTSD